jgi:hypothetical protein
VQNNPVKALSVTLPSLNISLCMRWVTAKAIKKIANTLSSITMKTHMAMSPGSLCAEVFSLTGTLFMASNSTTLVIYLPLL